MADSDRLPAPAADDLEAALRAARQARLDAEFAGCEMEALAAVLGFLRLHNNLQVPPAAQASEKKPDAPETKSWPLFGTFTSTPRPAGLRMRPSSRNRATRASSPSVPSMSSTATTWPSITTAAWPMSKGLSAASTSLPLAISADASPSGAAGSTSP